jgi:hypothetical protein
MRINRAPRTKNTSFFSIVSPENCDINLYLKQTIKEPSKCMRECASQNGSGNPLKTEKGGDLRGISPRLTTYKCKGPKNEAQHASGLVTLKDLPIPSTVLKDMRKYIR